MDKTPLISLHGVSQQWDGKRVLSDVDLDVFPQDFLAITGPNGGGKTTLMRIILKLLRPTCGTVEYLRDGHAVRSLPIGYLPQKNAIDSRFPITVREVVASGLLGKKTAGTLTEPPTERVGEILETVGLTAHASAGIGTLSGGQLQRALLGRALVSRPEVLVMDEPLSYVDQRFEQRIYDIIASIAPHTTIILVSHQMSVIGRMANRHFVVDGSLRCCHSHSHYPVC